MKGGDHHKIKAVLVEMERESLIGEGAGPAAKANYTTTPAPAPDSSRPKFIRKTVFGDVSLELSAFGEKWKAGLVAIRSANTVAVYT